MSQPQFSFRIGDVVIAGTFRVSPEALSDHTCSQSHAAVFAAPGGGATGMSRARYPSAEVPASLLVANAVARLSSAGMFHGYEVHMAHTGRARMLSRPVLGEPVTVIATVRYRSVRDAVAHVTFVVELRRNSGEIATRFEVGVDLRERGYEIDSDEQQAA